MSGGNHLLGRGVVARIIFLDLGAGRVLEGECLMQIGQRARDLAALLVC
jgi:hypothetical protein